MQSKSFLKIWFLSFIFEKLTSINLWTDFISITVEPLKCCDWSVHKFIKVNFSKLTDSNQIFMINFFGIHYHLGEIGWQIIECIFW